MLHRLAWSSVPSAHFSEARINEIIAPARRANARNHISGMLIFTGAHFVSILEGEERDLADLWDRLERDPRHGRLVRIGVEPCAARWFPKWLMAYTDHSVLGAQIETLRAPPMPFAMPWSESMHPMMLRADSM